MNYRPAEYAQEFKDIFGKMGYFVDIEGLEEEYNGIAIMVSDDPEIVCDWQNGEITSLYFWFHPVYKRHYKSEEEVKYLIHIASLGVKKSDRGNKISSKFFDIIIKTFDDDIERIEMNDMNKSGIWQYIASKYPHIEWRIN